MALGVMTLITVLSVMNGFDHEVKARILQIIPHATVDANDGVEDWPSLAADISGWPNVNAAVPYIAGQGMLSYRGRMQGVSMHGVPPEHSAIKKSLGQHLLVGELNALRADQYNILLGRLLAQALDVGVGDKVLLTLPEIVVTPAGIYPRVKQVRVAGIFETGAQVDSSIVFMHLNDAGKLLRLGAKVTGLRLFLIDPFSVEAFVSADHPLPNDHQLTTWYDSMKGLFTAIKMEKAVVGLLLSAIIGVAAFNIVASLVLMVNEKRTDIAVLRTMGSSPGDISRIFQIQGGLTGLVGVIVGVVGGCALALCIGDVLVFFERVLDFNLFDPALYFITYLPTKLQFMDVAVVATLGLILSLLATWYPAHRAGRVPPADALRYK